ncbi:hypothetical protein FRB94_002024 [Tulasnella sp. JGI-2019a]|nr:hypothetical protein FRB94_002024 [Tulasnella sp. JGI-2019a]
MDIDMPGIFTETRHAHSYMQLVVPMAQKRSRTPSSPTPSDRPLKRLNMDYGSSSRAIRSKPTRKRNHGGGDRGPGGSREPMILDTMKVTYTWTEEMMHDDDQEVDEISPMRLPPLPTFRLHTEIDPFGRPAYESQLQLFTNTDPFLVASSLLPTTPRHTYTSATYQPLETPPHIVLFPPTPQPKHPEAADARPPPSPSTLPFEPLETMSPLGHKGRLDRRNTAP